MLEGQTKERTDKPKKFHALIQESLVEIQTQQTEKSSDKLESGILQFFSGGLMVYFKEPYCFPRFRRGSIVFQGVKHFTGVVVNMLISIETYRAYYFPVGGS